MEETSAQTAPGSATPIATGAAPPPATSPTQTTPPIPPTPPPASPPAVPKKSNSVWIIIGILILIGIAAGGIVFYQQSTSNPIIEKLAKPTPVVTKEPTTESMSPAIEAVLAKKIIILEKLATDSALIDAVTSSGVKDSTLSKEQITKLDEDWKNTQGDSDFSRQFLMNTTAQILKKFQEDNPGFPEVFVTNKLGLNVGQTNKTSDYVQSDEDWWTTSYNSGQGKTSHGEIEYDESAQSRSVALYVPVYGADKNALGVIKAVLDIASIQQEL